MLTDAAIAADIPPEVVKAIAWEESEVGSNIKMEHRILGLMEKALESCK